jgi:Domain of unknown function (DUF4268)
MAPNLARLDPLDPRSVWPHEAHDFTPWLLANADTLGEVLGLDIELTANEHPVGGFALDLIGHDLTNDCVLIVENQLTTTDHSHLGQILTYAAGTEGETVVWMATDFREEHRQALDWLNGLAEGRARFFGIEIGAVRIGESLPAPLFKLRAQPNDWAAQISVAAKGATQAGGKGALYLKFWERFLERIHREHPTWTSATKPGTANWFAMPCPFKGGPYFSVGLPSGGRLRTELYLDYEQGSDAVEYLYSFLYDRRDEIEAIYGAPLDWEPLPKSRASRIAAYAEGDVSNTDEYGDYIDWFFDSLGRLREAMADPGRDWTGIPSQSD